MARNKRTRAKQAPYRYGYNKVKAQTQRMHLLVRISLSLFVLSACIAFFVATINPYRKLEKMRADLSEIKTQEALVLEKKDAKKRELDALDDDPQFLEVIARDRLNYYKPGEYVIRIQREDD